MRHSRPGTQKALALFLLLLAVTRLPAEDRDTSGLGVAGNDEVRKHIESFKGKGAVGDPNSKPLTPAESLASFTVPADLRIDLVASEPEVRQPLAMSFDERGRLWVVQYLQYPFPAGLKVVKYDQYLRAVFDKVPPAPPHHVRGADKITIHEDTDGDGRYDREKTFVDGLNIATSCARGRGGLWVLNPPYLLFYPDRNNDDLPDGDPEVHLQGFGLEDTHSVANSLCWGPDGWLYAGHGSTVTATVRRPGVDQEGVHFKGQAIWRYHPETKRFEIFAEGGGNVFSVEFDSQGRVYSGYNGGNARGFHYVQGGYYVKNWGKHGPLTNPYAFGFFPAIQHPSVERFNHTFVIYESTALPQHYHGHLFGPVPLHHYVVESRLDPLGSTFKTLDLEKVVTSSDTWFRPVDIKVGPDGGIYLADWYDTRLTHVDPRDTWDRTNGRIYRLTAKDAPASIAPFDLGKLSGDELVDLLSHPSKWHRQTALRLLGDRRDASLVPRLVKMIQDDRGQLALEALWAVNLCGGFDDRLALSTLSHENPSVRRWTVRLLGDPHSVSPGVAEALLQLAEREVHPEVRSQLASTARRLPAEAALPLIWSMVRRNEDAADPHIPLLLWWALESKLPQSRQTLLDALAIRSDDSPWREPIFRQFFISRIAQRLTAERSDDNLVACARLLELAPDDEAVSLLLSGMEAGLVGDAVQQVPEVLKKKLAALWNAGTPSVTLTRLGIRLGVSEATAHAAAMVADENAPAAQRSELIALFAERPTPLVLEALLGVFRSSRSPKLQVEALAALRRYNDPQVTAAVLQRLLEMDVAMRDVAESILVTRPESSLALLQLVESDKLKPAQIPVAHLLTIEQHANAQCDALIKKYWGRLRPSPEEKLERVAAVRKLLAQGKGTPERGKELFIQSCGKCHTLFAQGGKVGPELTGYERTNLDFMLPAIIDPSLAIREEFTNFNIVTTEGQVLSGLIVENTPQAVTLVNQEGNRIVVPRKDIDDLAASRISTMPDGLLDKLTDDQVRDLFSYLLMPAPSVAAGQE